MLPEGAQYTWAQLKGEHALKKVVLPVRSRNTSLHTDRQLFLSVPVGTCLFHVPPSNCLNSADRSSIQLTPYSSHFHWEQTGGTGLHAGFLLFLPYVLLFRLFYVCENLARMCVCEPHACSAIEARKEYLIHLLLSVA